MGTLLLELSDEVEREVGSPLSSRSTDWSSSILSSSSSIPWSCASILLRFPGLAVELSPSSLLMLPPARSEKSREFEEERELRLGEEVMPGPR